MYLFIVFCYPHHYKTFATATSNTIGGHLGKGKNVQVGIKAVYLTLRLFHRTPKIRTDFPMLKVGNGKYSAPGSPVAN
jgi:hypothetical protein